MSNKRESFAINRQASALGAGGHHHHEGPHLPPGMTLEDLDKPVSFTLTRSRHTVTLLHIPSICVHKDFAGMDAIKAKNDRYLALKDSKVGSSDKYSERAAQTINLLLKDKQSITDTSADAGGRLQRGGFPHSRRIRRNSGRVGADRPRLRLLLLFLLLLLLFLLFFLDGRSRRPPPGRWKVRRRRPTCKAAKRPREASAAAAAATAFWTSRGGAAEERDDARTRRGGDGAGGAIVRGLPPPDQ